MGVTVAPSVPAVGAFVSDRRTSRWCTPTVGSFASRASLAVVPGVGVLRCVQGARTRMLYRPSIQVAIRRLVVSLGVGLVRRVCPVSTCMSGFRV